MRIAIAVLFAFGQCAVPGFARFGFKVIKLGARLNGFHGLAVKFDDAEHGFDVVFGDGIRHASTTGIAVSGKRARGRSDVGALFVSVTGHDGGDGTGERTAFVGIIGQAVAHAERTEVRKAEAERAEDVGIFRDVLGRITRIIHENFLRRDINAHGGFEAFNVELVVGALELHQVQRSEIARGVIDENVFAAGVRGVDRLGAFARVPLLDRAVVLDARVAADVRAFGDFVEQHAGVLFLERLVAFDGFRPPFLASKRGFKKFVTGAHGKIFVLIHHTTIGIAVVRTVVTLFDQCPRLLFFLLLGINEFLDVTVPVAERVHLRGATRFAAGLHDVGDLVINF